MVDGLFCAHPFRIFSEGMPGVGVSVDDREITAGDGNPYPVPLFEDMACEHQVNMKLIDLARIEQ